MGIYKYIREAWKKPSVTLKQANRDRLIAWRKEPVSVRIERPTRLDRARSLGYKAKKGYIVVRQRVSRGGRMRPTIRKGRRPRHFRQKKVLDQSYQTIAEQRANRNHTNCEVLNSYLVAQDGLYYWFEIVLLDRTVPEIRKDPKTAWVTKSSNKGRVFKGKTSSGRKSRGLRNKGKGAEKLRPSRSAMVRRKVKRQAKK